MGGCFSEPEVKPPPSVPGQRPLPTAVSIPSDGDLPDDWHRNASIGRTIVVDPLSEKLEAFKFRDLQRATQQFKEPEMLLGEGGFGKVYKGWLRGPNGEMFPVAVKRLNPDSFQGQNEWLAEIFVLGRLRHPNLVRLLGYCAEMGEGLLVYEFLDRGSLDYHLFRTPDADVPPLSWETRLKIAFDAAQGLEHLHSNNVIHRDFKAPNILLDENYNAKLTDFGLAKGADTDMTHVTTRIMGTLGYLDPKYMETGQLTKKSDVYAFGILLLELLTGRRAIDQESPDSQSLAQWAQPFLQHRRPDLNDLLDPLLKDRFSMKETQRAGHKVAISARHCIEDDPNLRPVMSDIVETLKPLVKSANV